MNDFTELHLLIVKDVIEAELFLAPFKFIIRSDESDYFDTLF